jgi:hypothetical protein
MASILQEQGLPRHNSRGVLKMKNVSRSLVTGLSSLVLAAGVWALPGARQQSVPPAQSTPQPQAQSQSVTGKITAVDKSSFTLNVTPSQTSTPGQSLSAQTNPPKTMTFAIDSNTTVEGKLKVNSNAEVTYRDDNGTNVAISVHVTP